MLPKIGSMSTQQTISELGSTWRGPGGGEHYAFLNHLASVIVPGEGRSMSVVQFDLVEGFGPPEHVHENEDELFIIMAGELELRTAGEAVPAVEGSVAYLESGVAHTFKVVSPRARLLNVTTSNGATAPRFDLMVSTLGEALTEPKFPEPTAIDPGRVADVCAAFGITVVGPPPA